MSYLEEISDRINQVINRFSSKDGKQNISEFSRMTGFKPDTISTYIGKKGKKSMPGAEFISILVENFRISSDWILIGKGEMFAEEIPTVIPKLTDANEYLVKRFEEVINQLRDLKDDVEEKVKIIDVMAQELEILRAEKKEYIGYDIAAESPPELKKGK